MRSLQILATGLLLVASVQGQGFFRNGFKSDMERDFASSMSAGQQQLTVGMTQEMAMASGSDWQIQPLSFSSIKDKALRDHLQSYFNEPIRLKLSNRKGKHGMRAIGTMESSGKRIRAYWRQGTDTSRLNTGEMLEVSYDEAVRSRLPTLEFELQLPPVDKKKSKKLPSVVCSVAVEIGAINKKAMVPRGAGQVDVSPTGREEDSSAKFITAGRAQVTIPMKAGLVDPSWAKGRTIFRRGRPAGIV